MNQGQLWVLVGGNGAGKSTFFDEVLEPKGVAFVNSDLIAKSIRPDAPEAASYEAARSAVRLLRQYIDAGDSFAYETVFSHSSKVDLIRHAKKTGYEVNLIYFHLNDGLHLGRVRQRVAAGGHDVPDDKIVGRVPRTRRNVALAAPLVDTLILFDNSNKDDPFRQVAIKRGDRVAAEIDPLPEWAIEILFGGIAPTSGPPA